MCFEL
jgi:hypothetical protein